MNGAEYEIGKLVGLMESTGENLGKLEEKLDRYQRETDTKIFGLTLQQVGWKAQLALLGIQLSLSVGLVLKMWGGGH